MAINAKATYSPKAAKLFETRESGRETVKGILVSRDSRSGYFVVRDSIVRTESVSNKKKTK